MLLFLGGALVISKTNINQVFTIKEVAKLVLVTNTNLVYPITLVGGHNTITHYKGLSNLGTSDHSQLSYFVVKHSSYMGLVFASTTFCVVFTNQGDSIKHLKPTKIRVIDPTIQPDVN